MDKKKTTVPVLIVNYNGKQYLHDCLSSLFACSYHRIEQVVYVVDNASTDDSKEYLRRTWPEVHLIESHENLGFAGGNNLGWQRIKEDMPDVSYVFLLNQDTIVTKNFLEPLLVYSSAHE